MKEVDDNFTLKNKSIQWTFNRTVSSSRLKAGGDIAAMTPGGKLFHKRAAATPKAQLPMTRVSADDDAERIVASRRCLPYSADHVLAAAPEPCRQRKVSVTTRSADSSVTSEGHFQCDALELSCRA